MNKYLDIKNKRVVGRRITLKTGSEGSPHDPWGFEEFQYVTKWSDGTAMRITVHEGIGCWVEVRTFSGIKNPEKFMPINRQSLLGEQPNIYTKKVKLENESLANKFLYEVTGITYDELNKYYNKLKWKCKTCHSSKRIGHTEDGYPGETFYHCKCGGYITTTMNYSEIE